MKLLSRLICVALVWGALPTPARADDPRLTIFVGTSHGADAQLHPALAPINCYHCDPLAVPRYATGTPPALATIGAGLAATSGAVRGGGELFSLLTVSGDQTSAYVGLLTFAGIDLGRVFGLIGFGGGKFINTWHRDVLSSFAMNARAELGVHLARGWAVSARADLIYNNISSTNVFTFGLSWAP